ncbi:uncharacterized protein [Onthophagus taurus]|uniref:uncharacterized protein isoform X2 n=1 Tax=Onthophagus taurus TaxID=166361 RepID=UPI000C1FDBA1|nr:uncharacterized protein LOC111418183 isoform X2 [Onthophagus taurus]
MEKEFKLSDVPRKERNFPTLELTEQNLNANATQQPLLVINSPKTPTLCRKLKAVSLDSDPQKPSNSLEVNRDVISMPNTPKRQVKQKLLCDFDDGAQKFTLTPSFSSNLSRFGSNTSISGSQTLKTLPEVMTLQDFSDNNKVMEPVRLNKTKGLLERRGSNASLTIDLGSTLNINEIKTPIIRLNPARSVNNLNLSSFGHNETCNCLKRPPFVGFDRRKSQTHIEKCDNCTIYEAVPSKNCVVTKMGSPRKCCCLCSHKSRRKSLSNENLYVPPCNICQGDLKKECTGLAKGHRRACYPRQADLDASQLLSDDFKFYLQNVQYLQTAGNVLNIEDLKMSCEMLRVPKIHQEFWEVPLNLQEKCLVSGSQSRNRYRGVLPNEHSRVILTTQQSYIHANYIKGPDYTENCYIATQGPMMHTCEDFWQMCNCIVMLTNLVEKGRSKCELYFPLGRRVGADHKTYLTVKTRRVQDRFTFDRTQLTSTAQYEEETFKFEETDEVFYGNFRIRFLKKQQIGESCTLRMLSVTKSGESGERLIKHFWFSNWQDHKMANPETVLNIAKEIIDVMDRNAKNVTKKNVNNTSKRNLIGSIQEKPMVIAHCSAGIGRTGCFLAILNGIQQLRNTKTVDVLAILCSLRLHRGGMVQTAEQYELIHRVLRLYAEGM